MNQFQNQIQKQRKDNNNNPRVTRFIGGDDEEYIPTQKELDEAQEKCEKLYESYKLARAFVDADMDLPPTYTIGEKFYLFLKLLIQYS